jgi:arylsulfatase A-like enzyme
MGWNELREQIFANQKRLGVIPANTELTEWPDTLAKWETLSDDEKRLFARQAEVFAAYTAYTDHEIGRVIKEVEDQGKLDNTLIIYICGDNGTSPEGTLVGTPNQYTAYDGFLDVPIEEQLRYYDTWGQAPTYPHMAVAWSWAFDTPFKWTKQVASHFGGTRQGLTISWPARISDAGGIRTQFHHIIDIAPTILEATGIAAPQTVDGIAQKPIEGVSMVYTFDKANADASSARTTQYFEMAANRGIYHDGWYANTTPPIPPWVLNAKTPNVNDYAWELYNVRDDYSQAHDLASQMPREAEGDAGPLPRGGEKEQRPAARQFAIPACDGPASEPDRRPDRIHLFRRHARHPGRGGAEHSQPVVHDHRRGRNSRWRRRNDRYRRRLGRWIRALLAGG